MTKDPASGIQVIARAAAILRACKDGGRGLSLGQIAERVGLARSTVQRIVGALAAEGLLLTGDGIRLGPGLQSLAGATRFDTVETAHPHLKRLSRTTGETVDLALLRHGHMVFVDQIAGSQRLQAVSAVGEQFPLHCTANGKAALALLDDRTILKLCGPPLKRFTASTIVKPKLLLAEIERVRKGGAASDREEHSAGICAVGAAFKDVTGEIYAISIPIPVQRFKNNGTTFETALLKTLKRLKLDLGSAS